MKKEKNYKSIFAMGTIFMAVGVVFLTTINQPLGSAFIAIGCLFLVVGAKNKDKWD